MAAIRFPATGYLAEQLGARAVISVHQPMTAAGHGSTQFQLLGPDGEPPLMCRRTIAAHAEDRHWSWHESGKPMPFEQPERYRARRRRDRLDRVLLAEYLQAMGIAVDDEGSYAEAVLVRQRVDWPTRNQTLAEARARTGV
jgi:hypothetical protein